MNPRNISTETTRPRIAPGVHPALRVGVGYLVAVGAGYCIFLFLFEVWPGNPVEPLQTFYYVDHTPYRHLTHFLEGAVFGIPYTILGVLAVKKVLPRSIVAFLLVGMFCPASALALLLSINGLVRWLDDAVGVFLLTLPAGLVSAYVFGAIGMGWGFGRWRFA